MQVAPRTQGASEEPSKENTKTLSSSSGLEPVKVSAVENGFGLTGGVPARRCAVLWRSEGGGWLPAPHPQAEPRTSALVSPSVDRHFSLLLFLPSTAAMMSVRVFNRWWVSSAAGRGLKAGSTAGQWLKAGSCYAGISLTAPWSSFTSKESQLGDANLF